MIALESIPYCDNQENLLDYIRFCILCLDLMEGDNHDAVLSQIAVRQELIEHREAATPPYVGLALPALRHTLALDDCSYFCVVFALGCELDGSLRAQVQAQCGSIAPTFDLVFSLYSTLCPVSPAVLFSLPNPHVGQLRFALRLEDGFTAQQPLLAAPLLLRRNILHFLVCGTIAPCKYYSIAIFDEPYALPLHEESLHAAEIYLSDASAGADSLYLCLAGVAGAGKRTLLRRIAAAHGIPCAFLDCALLGTLSPEQLSQLSLQLTADLLLSGAMLCLTDLLPDNRRCTEDLLGALPTGILLFVTVADGNPPPMLCSRSPVVSAVSTLSWVDYSAAWRRLSELYPVKTTLEDAVPAYNLTIGKMEQAWALAAHFCRSEHRDHIGMRDFTEAVRRLNLPVGGGVTVHSDVTLDDMVIDAETRARLRLICDFARQERTVCREWGFAARLPYGRGVTALLCGASGTGKTMAAAAIANELGLELLRLDLSQILDKYIGETEKKLAAVFAEASRGNYILFFDEADALFSKRTEISSSHDRYANMETSFLLQSIEQYDGMVLLATNLFRNFDEAFLRRINIIARFPMPGEALRLILWKSAFPPETPIAPELDFILLARELDISPAVIKNAALCAAVLACADGKPVGMEHLLSGLRNELEKSGQESQLIQLMPATNGKRLNLCMQ